MQKGSEKMKNLMDRGIEVRSDTSGSWVKIAFNEILATIYHSGVTEKQSNEVVETLAHYVMKKLDIKEEDLNWQIIEDEYSAETYKFADWYLDFSEIKKIISKSKVSEDYEWEDIESKEMPIDKINQKIISNFKETIDTELTISTKEELIKKYTED